MGKLTKDELSRKLQRLEFIKQLLYGNWPIPDDNPIMQDVAKLKAEYREHSQ